MSPKRGTQSTLSAVSDMVEAEDSDDDSDDADESPSWVTTGEELDGPDIPDSLIEAITGDDIDLQMDEPPGGPSPTERAQRQYERRCRRSEEASYRKTAMKLEAMLEQLKRLPLRIDKEEYMELHDLEYPDRVADPSATGPQYCDYCGMRHPVGPPLERGRAGVYLADPVYGDPMWENCGAPNDCECCGCPSCFNQSIYSRDSKEPTWRCHNPDCLYEFHRPVNIEPEVDRAGEARYHSCRSCDLPILVEGDGPIADRWFPKTDEGHWFKDGGLFHPRDPDRPGEDLIDVSNID